jgi:hypothetical protein
MAIEFFALDGEWILNQDHNDNVIGSLPRR